MWYIITSVLITLHHNLSFISFQTFATVLTHLLVTCLSPSPDPVKFFFVLLLGATILVEGSLVLGLTVKLLRFFASTSETACMPAGSSSSGLWENSQAEGGLSRSGESIGSLAQPQVPPRFCPQRVQAGDAHNSQTATKQPGKNRIAQTQRGNSQFPKSPLSVSEFNYFG